LQPPHFEKSWKLPQRKQKKEGIKVVIFIVTLPFDRFCPTLTPLANPVPPNYECFVMRDKRGGVSS
jgi:hypothetical protein